MCLRYARHSPGIVLPRFNNLHQPAVHEQLGGLQEHGRSQEHRGELDARRRPGGRGERSFHVRQVERVPVPVQQYRRAHKTQFGQATCEEFLARRGGCVRPLAGVRQQQVQRHTARGPRQSKSREIPRCHR